ncbi:MAG: pyridoxamine 5'-phosphate oxidase family protein [Candidatus Latescibacteria bacterium]|nr:pyridoxamine 5'-phosphate oxidase family protein [Candidatus Latescibacterota bacterium]
MSALPEAVSTAWEDREGPIVLATVDSEGNPNAIYATCVSKFSEDTLVVADNFFDKTRANILGGGKGSLLFITKEGKSFQVKGPIEYHTEGAVFDDMKKWNSSKLPGHAAAALKVEHVFSGAEKLA